MGENSAEKIKFNAMTINMKGAGRNCRKEAKDVIITCNKDDFPSKPDIIFVQELPQVEWKMESKVEGYSHSPYGVTNREAGIMWRTNTFEFCPIIDEPFKWERQYWNVLPNILCRKYIPHRLCPVVLQHKTEGYKVLAVSWHGPENSVKDNSKDTDEEKLEKGNYATVDLRKRHIFENLQKYINAMFQSLERREPALKCIVIGGDFNLDFRDQLTENCLEGFYFKEYTMSVRRQNNPSQNLIDNFLVYPQNEIDVSVPMPFTNLSLKHLDHDPVLASVNLNLSVNYHKPTSDGKSVLPNTSDSTISNIFCTTFFLVFAKLLSKMVYRQKVTGQKVLVEK